MNDRTTFGLHSDPLPKNAKGKSFYEQTPCYKRLKTSFALLVREPGLGVLTSESGVGKTSSVRNLCGELPYPDYKVIYLCETNLAPFDLHRNFAIELGVRPSFSRGQLWADSKKALLHMVDDLGSRPILVIDEAQNLADSFLLDLCSFLNFAFDSRDLLTLWLVGTPQLTCRLRQVQHAPLRSRICTQVHLLPLDHDTFLAAVDYAFKAAGATTKILSDQAAEMLFRSSRGILRTASRLLRYSLRIARERSQTFLDEPIVQAAIEELEAS